MATQSILKNIVITEPEAVEIFVDAMEKAIDSANHIQINPVESKDLTGESLKQFLGSIQKQ